MTESEAPVDVETAEETLTEPLLSDDVPEEVESASRQGTTASARFNILSTMVGGGSLSLPLAFQKSGALLGPLILLFIAGVTYFCFGMLIASARLLSPPTAETNGKDSFESITAAAFGNRAHTFSKALVIFMCFFGTVGYAVLLRDMLEPIQQAVWDPRVTFVARNWTMWSVVVLVTPLCTLRTLTALQRFGAFSMFSIVVLGVCIVYRSTECNVHHPLHIQWFPDSWKDVLDAFPLFVSCYVCHYNIPTVHNELRQPSEGRVRWWLQSTTLSATVFYLIMGIAGSAYAPCTADGHVQGNILLDMDPKDPLLLVGRMCLAVTVTLAFPMLTIPARDILLRSRQEQSTTITTEGEGSAPEDQVASDDDETLETTWKERLSVATVVLWLATLLASCVDSIDIVWDLLGSSLSMLLSYLIPAASYLVIVLYTEAEASRWSLWGASVLLVVTLPLMVISTINAIYNTV